MDRKNKLRFGNEHPKVDPGVSEEDLKALRALGYVE